MEIDGRLVTYIKHLTCQVSIIEFKILQCKENTSV